MTARDHNKLLAIFYFVMAGLQLLGGIFMFIVYVVLGGAMMSTSSRDEDQMVGGIFMGIGVIAGIVMLLIGLLTLFTASSVLKQKPIGRTLAIVLSILSLFSIPLGTALGIYGLWFFLGDTGKNFYDGLSGSASSPPPPPPAPNSWQ